MIEFEWLHASPNWIVLLIPLLAFIESCLGIGLFVSGIFLLSTCTLLYGQQLVGIPVIAISALLGAISGDLVGYMAGKLIGPGLKTARLFNRFEPNIVKAETLFSNSAGIAICVGRLIPAVRSITPMLAGISGLPTRKYLLFDLVACTLWVSALCILVTGINSSIA
jgi:membrane-associated protein